MNFMNKVPIRDIFVPALGQDKVNRLSYVAAGQYGNYFMFFVTSRPQAVIIADSVSNTRIF